MNMIGFLKKTMNESHVVSQLEL